MDKECKALKIKGTLLKSFLFVICTLKIFAGTVNKKLKLHLFYCSAVLIFTQWAMQMSRDLHLVIVFKSILKTSLENIM